MPMTALILQQFFIFAPIAWRCHAPRFSWDASICQEFCSFRNRVAFASALLRHACNATLARCLLKSAAAAPVAIAGQDTPSCDRSFSRKLHRFQELQWPPRLEWGSPYAKARVRSFASVRAGPNPFTRVRLRTHGQRWIDMRRRRAYVIISRFVRAVLDDQAPRQGLLMSWTNREARWRSPPRPGVLS
jgi:hypothetical protein